MNIKLMLTCFALLLACANQRQAVTPLTTPVTPTTTTTTTAPHGTTEVGCIGITVSDLDRSTSFFTSTLDVKTRSTTDDDETKRTRTFALGNECIVLTQYAALGRAINRDARSNDRTFQHMAIVVSDMDQAYARLEAHHVEHASVSPQTLPAWNHDAGGIRAYYFKDPDGHVLEAIWFPPGKGDRRWREPSSKGLFLGIDHTAIVVADTGRSLRFYAQRGFRVAGASENWGIEQERLNNVPHAHLRITGLRGGGGGPGIELLEYLAPRDGRDAPTDSSERDIAHWETTLIVSGSNHRETVERDPDGHVMHIRERAK